MIQKNINNYILKNKIRDLTDKEIVLNGWKGKDALEIYKLNNEFKVVEHRKSKTTGKISKIIHLIPLSNVLFILNILDNIENETTKARYLWDDIITILKINIDVNAFNGGYNRNKYYFPLYYYPIKILEYYKIIEYRGNGKIIKSYLNRS